MNRSESDKKNSRRLNYFIVSNFKWLLILVLIGGSVIGYWNVKTNRDRLRAEKDREIANVSQQVTAKNKQVAEMKVKVKDFDFIQAQSIEVIKKILPTLDRKQDLLLYIRDMLQEEDYILTSIAFGSPSNLQNRAIDWSDISLPIVVVPIKLGLTGATFNYDKLKSLLQVLHNRYFIFSLQRLRLGKSLFSDNQEEEQSFGLEFDVLFLDESETSEASGFYKEMQESKPKKEDTQIITPEMDLIR